MVDHLVLVYIVYVFVEDCTYKGIFSLQIKPSSFILTLAEKVADNAALWLVESTKAADVDIVIVHAARDNAPPRDDSARLKTCFMARTNVMQ